MKFVMGTTFHRSWFLIFSGIAFIMFLLIVPLAAYSQTSPPPLPALAQEEGSETGLPLPRFVSIKASEANIRRGPAFNQRIDWIYRQRDLPVLVVDEYEHWRRIQDVEGAGGWIHYSLLSGNRTIIVVNEEIYVHSRPQRGAGRIATLQKNVVARIRECTPQWCKILFEGRTGWIERDGIWGLADEEVIE